VTYILLTFWRTLRYFCCKIVEWCGLLEKPNNYAVGQTISGFWNTFSSNNLIKTRKIPWGTPYSCLMEFYESALYQFIRRKCVSKSSNVLPKGQSFVRAIYFTNTRTNKNLKFSHVSLIFIIPKTINNDNSIEKYQLEQNYFPHTIHSFKLNYCNAMVNL
jgi:hypothetical protein